MFSPEMDFNGISVIGVKYPFTGLNVILHVPSAELQPPEGSTQDSLVTVEFRDRSKLLLCAESEDDAV